MNTPTNELADALYSHSLLNAEINSLNDLFQEYSELKNIVVQGIGLEHMINSEQNSVNDLLRIEGHTEALQFHVGLESNSTDLADNVKNLITFSIEMIKKLIKRINKEFKKIWENLNVVFGKTTEIAKRISDAASKIGNSAIPKTNTVKMKGVELVHVRDIILGEVKLSERKLTFNNETIPYNTHLDIDFIKPLLTNLHHIIETSIIEDSPINISEELSVQYPHLKTLGAPVLVGKTMVFNDIVEDTEFTINAKYNKIKTLAVNSLRYVETDIHKAISDVNKLNLNFNVMVPLKESNNLEDHINGIELYSKTSKALMHYVNDILKFHLTHSLLSLKEYNK